VPSETWKELVDMDVDDLHIKPSDAVDHSKWREMGKWMGTKRKWSIMMVMPELNTNCRPMFLMLPHPG